MKKCTMMALALIGIASLSAENSDACCSLKQQAVSQKAPVSAATNLSAEEQAFAAKLSDQNRKAFVEKLTAEHRKEAMLVAKDATAPNAPDEAVSKFANSDVAQAEKVPHNAH